MAAAGPLPDNPLKVARARGIEERLAPRAYVVHVEQPRLNPRHDGLQPALPLEQRPVAHILAFDGQQVEGHKGRPVPPKQQLNCGRERNIKVYASPLRVRTGASRS